ncbi:MAG: hypothetical protein HY454_02200 [Parcubacteria group bacterium]|nr:hypothetical protein [Parcubacteria group bacterium]
MKKFLLLFVLSAAGVAVGMFVYLSAVKGSLVGKASHPVYGDYLADQNGVTLYVYRNDRLGKEPSCDDQCLALWTPFLSKGKDPQKSSDPLTKNLRLITRKDGSIQYTYLGKPLYYFKTDKNPGDLTGRGLNNLWSIVLVGE